MISRRIIEELAAEELVSANTKHDPTFNSQHEAYAVIKEEVEEMLKEINWMQFSLDRIWELTKSDDNCTKLYEKLKESAISAVQEGIQVIAMCDKAMNCTKM